MLPEGLTLWAVVSASLVDSVNPCTLAVLFFLLTTMTVQKDKRNIFLRGLSFTAAIFIMYILMGFGLIQAFNFIGVKAWFYYIVGSLAVVIGLMNLHDFVKNKQKGCMFSPRIQKVINKATSVPMMFVAGLFCSLFLLPCTSGPYVVITGIISDRGILSALPLLLLYNAIFVLPLLIITVLSAYGLETAFEMWHIKSQRKIALVTSMIMLALGVGVIIYTILTTGGGACAI